MTEHQRPAIPQRESRIVFVSTYPPTQCGIATYTQSLLSATNDSQYNHGSGVIRLVSPHDTGDDVSAEEVTRVRVDDPGWVSEVLATCQPEDVLWIQHEYGIFGPDDGLAVTQLARRAPVPVVVTLHTVPADPSRRQQEILQDLVDAAKWVVVMSEEARKRLARLVIVDPGRVRVISHGAMHSVHRLRQESANERPTIVNWGLIGPGKGLEWAVRAMPGLRHLDPLPRLVIRGVTHPNVLRRDGESYRRSLEQLVSKLGVEDMVDMQSVYMSRAGLTELMDMADFVLLPYDSTEQVTSGVLVDAIGAGLPVIASAFPHAVEMLSTGAGTVVPHRSPGAIAEAIEIYVTDSATARDARREVRRLARELSWSKVASQHLELAQMATTRKAAGAA